MFAERLFSIGITKLALNSVEGIDNNVLNEIVKNSISNPHNYSNAKRSIDLNNPNLSRLNQIVLETSQGILNQIISNPDIDTFRVCLQKAWGNINTNDDISIPHTHRESFLSAVYYPQSTDGKIYFQSPWTDHFLSHVPGFHAREFNEFNSTYHILNPKTGWLIFFPASLIHFVPPSKEERSSIVYNIGVETK